MTKGHKIRFGVAGCGRIFEKHLEVFRNLSDLIELVAVCDIDPKALSNAVEKTGAQGFSSLSLLLQKSNADVISLCTPSGIHAEQTVEVARSGRHIVSEKPMALKWEDGLTMTQAADQNKVSLFVVKQNRFNPTVSLLKKALEKGRFGKIHMISSNVFWQRPQSYFDQAPWRGTHLFDGGAFMNQASHYVDLLTWLGGPIDELFAMTARLGRKIETEDCGAVALRWKSGAVGSINVTLMTYPKNLEGSITVLGENGTARITGIALNKISQWEFASPDVDDNTLQQVNYETASVYGNGHLAFYQNVIACVMGQDAKPVSGREGLVSLATLVAIKESAEKNRPVKPPQLANSSS